MAQITEQEELLGVAKTKFRTLASFAPSLSRNLFCPPPPPPSPPTPARSGWAVPCCARGRLQCRGWLRTGRSGAAREVVCGASDTAIDGSTRTSSRACHVANRSPRRTCTRQAASEIESLNGQLSEAREVIAAAAAAAASERSGLRTVVLPGEGASERARRH